MIIKIIDVQTSNHQNRIKGGERGKLKPLSATLKIVVSMGRERLKKETSTSALRGTAAMAMIVPILKRLLGGGSVGLHYSYINI